MRWLPEYGVGHHRVRQPHLHRLGTRRDEAFDVLAKTGGLEPRDAAVAGADRARDTVSRLVMQWDDAAASRIAAVNLFLDRDEARRKPEIDALKARVGACTPATASTSSRTRCAASGR